MATMMRYFVAGFRRFRDPRRRRVVAAVLALAVGGPGAAAQTTTPDVEAAPALPGWTLTPTLVFSTSRDDNVLIHEAGDNPPADVVNVINPRAAFDYRGRLTELTGTYDGALLLYRDFGSLNSYDQRAGVRVRRRLSPRLSLFAADTLAVSPTTEFLQLAGVPFVRTGSSLNDLSSGIEAAMSKRTSLNAGVQLQWVQFDEARPVDPVLRGGHSQGGSLGVRHRLSTRTTLTVDYNLHHAVVAEGQASFDVQNGLAGVEHLVARNVRLFAAGGFSHLGLSTFGPARNGATYRAGLSAVLPTAGVDVAYSRAFVPSFGFGGTMQNEDLTAQLRAALSRRAYAQSSFSWRRNDPLTLGEPSLRSRSLQVVAGYAVQTWMRVEGFYAAHWQTIDRPGGMLDRTRLGFQIVTSKPMRVR
jgi:hypothetical protein